MDFGLTLMPKGTIWMINCYFFTCKNGNKDSLGGIRNIVGILGIIKYILKIHTRILGFIFFSTSGGGRGVPGIEPRVSYALDKHSTTELHFRSYLFLLYISKQDLSKLPRVALNSLCGTGSP